MHWFHKTVDFFDIFYKQINLPSVWTFNFFKFDKRNIKDYCNEKSADSQIENNCFKNLLVPVCLQLTTSANKNILLSSEGLSFSYPKLLSLPDSFDQGIPTYVRYYSMYTKKGKTLPFPFSFLDCKVAHPPPPLTNLIP